MTVPHADRAPTLARLEESSRSRTGSRGASSAALLGGATLLLGGLGLGLFLSSQTAPPQGVYEAPVVVARPVPKRTRPPRSPDVILRSGSMSESAVPAHPQPVDAPDSPDATASTPSSMATAPASPPSSAATPDPAVLPAETPGATSPGAIDPNPVETAVGSGRFRSDEIGIRLVGQDASTWAEGVTTLLRTKSATQGALAHVRIAASEKTDAPLDGARAVLALESGGLRVMLVAPPPLDVDLVAELLPPTALAGDALRDIRLPVADSRRAIATAALVALLAGDADACLSLTDGAGKDAGLRVLTAYAHLARSELPVVHEGVLGLGTDADVGPVVRFLTGAALLVGQNPREAIRDLSAAVKARPTYWPARLLLGMANDRLALPEAAREHYGAVLTAVPGRPEAVVGFAPYLAADDRPAAISMVERLLAERPAFVPGWWQLAWLRRKGDTSEDKQKEVEALEHVVALRPTGADAWGALGGSRTRWAANGGGVAAYEAASRAFAKQCELTPEDGLAWYGRAATLHQVALETPLAGDASVLPKLEAATAEVYVKALARGLPKSDAARVHFNLGLLLTDVVAWPAGTVLEGVPRRASESYAAALAADPGYAEAALALFAARIGERDVKEAMRALATLPPGVDPHERGVLEAALAHVKGDPAAATRLLSGPGRAAVTGADPLTPLAKELLLLGYRRLVVLLLAGPQTDPFRLAIRVRANAGLGDVTATKADVAALESLDAPRAADLRRNDRDVKRTLGAASKGS